MWAGAGPWGCGHGGTIWGAGEGQWLWKLETWGTKEQFQGRRAGRRPQSRSHLVSGPDFPLPGTSPPQLQDTSWVVGGRDTDGQMRFVGFT